MDSMRPESRETHNDELIITLVHIIVLSLLGWAAAALMGACS